MDNHINKQQQTIVRTLEVTEICGLLEFLLEKFKDINKNKIKRTLSNKLVCINGKVVSQFDYQLVPGMKVSILRRTDSLIENPYISLIYEDPWIIVINKKPGILSMQSDHHSFCVKTLLDNYFRRKHTNCTAHVVHRLDRETSGLMVFAKDTKVQQILENNWHDLVKDRRYIAVVSGKMEHQNGTIRSWLKDDKFFYTFSSPIDNGGKLAITHFETKDICENYSLVELKLETGRKNQIRVHLQTLQHPVIGDYKYGFEGDDPIKRLGLHAFRLFFIHPVTHKFMEFETPYPTPFLNIFKNPH